MGKRPRPRFHFLFEEDRPEDVLLLAREVLFLPPFSSSLEPPFWCPLSLSWVSFLVRFSAADDEDVSVAAATSSRSFLEKREQVITTPYSYLFHSLSFCPCDPVCLPTTPFPGYAPGWPCPSTSTSANPRSETETVKSTFLGTIKT